jgi:hypothetical protein
VVLYLVRALPIVWSIFTARPEPVNLGRLSYLAGLRFPPSARVVSSSYGNVVRANLRAEVRFGRSDLHSFLDSQRPPVAWSPEPGSSPSAAPGGPAPHGSKTWSAVVNPPRHHPRPPYQDLKVVDVLVTVPERGGVVVSIEGAGD